jgi:general secretion pathway protein A
LFLSSTHIETLAHLDYALSERRGVTLLLGEVGTGKTTLLRTALDRARATGVVFAHLSNPTLKRAEFYRLLAREFQLSAAAGMSKAEFLIELHHLVEAQRDKGSITALVVDEAQSLPVKLLEEIRFLANLETATEKLLQVILVGQPELADRLNTPELRQLRQRIAMRCRLEPLKIAETAAYIAGRVRIAGGDAVRLFTREAIAEIHERSNGIPRIVSVICDNALVTGFAAGKRPVDREVVLEVCRDFDFRRTSRARPGDIAQDGRVPEGVLASGVAQGHVRIPPKGPPPPAPAQTNEPHRFFGRLYGGRS